MDFLPPQAPSNASIHRIDFATSTPPLPVYSGLFAAVIDNFLTEAECRELLRRAEATTVPNGNGNGNGNGNDHDHGNGTNTSTPTWERATINIGNGKQALATDTRNCGRIIVDTPDLAARLLQRLRPFLHELGVDRIADQPRITGLAGRGKTYHVARINERLRFLKYEGGEYFHPHGDAAYVVPGEAGEEERSLITIHVYLNGEGEQDLEELRREKRAVGGMGEGNHDVDGKLLGGATSFMDIRRFEKEDEHVRVFPRTGSVLVFQQRDLLHGGDPVLRGTKYTMRTDIMYRQ